MADDKDDLTDLLEEMDVDEEPTPDPKKAAPKKAAPKKAATKPRNMTRIQLEENDDIPPTGLYVGHNGRGYLIRAGMPVDVPDHIIEILDHAIMSQPIIDPQSRRVTGYRNRMRYPYRNVS